MSILNNTNAHVQIPPAKTIAQNIRIQTRSVFENMIEIFNSSSEKFWKNAAASPQEIAAELGSDAKEIFELHSKLGALLASIKPESIEAGSGMVGDFTINDDGSVTIMEKII